MSGESGGRAPPSNETPSPAVSSSFRSSLLDFSKDDNPFLRQRELMLAKSTDKSVSASVSRTRSWRDVGRSTSPHASVGRGRSGGSTAFTKAVGGGFAGHGSDSKPWAQSSSLCSARRALSTAEPKNSNMVVSPKITNQQQQQQRTGPINIFDMSSDDEETEDRLQISRSIKTPVTANENTPRVTVTAQIPTVAEAKVDKETKCYAAVGEDGGNEGDDDDGDDDGRPPSPAPSSDGGWPETKRCPPPNLNCRSSSTSSSVHRIAADKKRKGDIDDTEKPVGVGITGSWPVDGGGITRGGKLDGSRTNGTRTSRGGGSSSGGGGGGGGRADLDGDWMSEAEDRRSSAMLGRSGQPPEMDAGTASGTTPSSTRKSGLKRGRTPPIQSQTDGGTSSSDGSCNSGRRGSGKTGRCERYPTPVPPPRRLPPRSSSLSLTPPRISAFDSDYDSAEDNAATAAAQVEAKVKGKRSTTKTSSSTTGIFTRSDHSNGEGTNATMRRRSKGIGEGEKGGSRGRKRDREEYLNDRIEAMRVGSDDEGGSHLRAGGGGDGDSGGSDNGKGRRIGDRVRDYSFADPMGERRGGGVCGSFDALLLYGVVLVYLLTQLFVDLASPRASSKEPQWRLKRGREVK